VLAAYHVAAGECAVEDRDRPTEWRRWWMGFCDSYPGGAPSSITLDIGRYLRTRCTAISSSSLFKRPLRRALLSFCRSTSMRAASGKPVAMILREGQDAVPARRSATVLKACHQTHPPGHLAQGSTSWCAATSHYVTGRRRGDGVVRGNPRHRLRFFGFAGKRCSSSL